ncbi:hypothetical protein N0V85_005306 [Neurospora sp. IMI 360204]|nr:hypothetical protein N0V85_005306 [Neurospora sp. IMI 360204]
MPMTFIETTPESPRDYFVMAEPFRKGLASYIYYNEDPRDSKGCSPTFDDPMDDILKTFRELVLRLAIVDVTVPYRSHQVRVLYAAQIPALVLATVISLLGPLATIFLFWGWWNLGRDFSMNPLELVNALLVRGPGTETRTGRGQERGQGLTLPLTLWTGNDKGTKVIGIAIHSSSRLNSTWLACRYFSVEAAMPRVRRWLNM